MAARRVVVIPRRDTRPGILLFIILSRSLVVEYLQILGSMRNQVKARTINNKSDYSHII